MEWRLVKSKLVIRERIGSEWLGSGPARKGTETPQLHAFFNNRHKLRHRHTHRLEEVSLVGVRVEFNVSSEGIVKKWVKADWLQCVALSNTAMCVSTGDDSLAVFIKPLQRRLELDRGFSNWLCQIILHVLRSTHGTTTVLVHELAGTYAIIFHHDMWEYPQLIVTTFIQLLFSSCTIYI